VKRVSIFLLTVAFLAFVTACTGFSDGQRSDELQQLIDQVRSSSKTPGLAMAVFSSDSVYFAGVSGVRKLGGDDALQVSDRFHLGSCTKAILAFTAAALVEEGAIDWDDKFFDMYPELMSIAGPDYHDITLRQLLSHRAGMVSKKTELYQIMYPNMGSDTTIDRTELFAWAWNREKYTGGFQYSNTGYVMAAHMLEKATGRDWKSLVQEKVFGPLEVDGHFDWPAKGDVNQPWGHYSDPATGAFAPHDPNDVYYLSRLSLDPAGDINMSMQNYIKFLQDNLKGCAKSGGILSEESYRLIHSGDEYGFGWGIVDSPRHRRISTHSGSAGTFFCKAILLKDFDLGMLIFMNAASGKSEAQLAPLQADVLEMFVKD
jgi:CubicO group peptidase (beta-lactamase class C family)